MLKLFEMLKGMLPWMLSIFVSLAVATGLLLARLSLPAFAFVPIGIVTGYLAGLLQGSKPQLGIRLPGLRRRLWLGALIGGILGVLLMLQGVPLQGLSWFPVCVGLGTYLGLWLQVKGTKSRR
ncbi:MAG: hypothetical protein ACAI44_24640 [Candidatus Sericytochromatia bacterium]